jgi:hypothetical protein
MPTLLGDVLATLKTQDEARLFTPRIAVPTRSGETTVQWARNHDHIPHVRHLNDKDKPDHWRKI